MTEFSDARDLLRWVLFAFMNLYMGKNNSLLSWLTKDTDKIGEETSDMADKGVMYPIGFREKSMNFFVWIWGVYLSAKSKMRKSQKPNCSRWMFQNI